MRPSIACAIAALLLAALAVPAPAALPPGDPVLSTNIESLKLLGGANSQASAQTVTVQGQPFTKALRARTAKRPQFAYSIQLSAPTSAPVAKGDVLLLTFWCRAVETSADDGQAQVGCAFERRGPPYNKSLEEHVGVGKSWQRFQLPFVADDGYAAGMAQMNFQLGFTPQTVEIGGVELLNFRKAVKPADLPRTRRTYAGREPDAPWRKAAAERIERLRKADLTVVVTDAAGKPVPGATVEVRMRRHAFGFGSAVTAEMLLGDSPDAKQYQQHVRNLFSRVVLENDLKWQGWTGNRQRGLDAVAWLHKAGIEVRGHNLVWPGWQYLPKEIVALKGQPDALRKAIADHVTDEATALRGRLVEWDVINEPWNNHDVADVLGKDVLADWLRLAKAADPTARLFVNDFPTLTSPASGDAHLAGFEQILRNLIDQKAPLEGIGFQCHYKGDFTPPEQILRGLDHFAQLGRPIAITEFDYDTIDEDLQADATRDLLTAAFSHPAVNEVIMWGFWESRHWRPVAAMYRKDWTQKPNGKAWEELVKKQWWTNADGKTGKDGRYAVRGFLGEYEVTVRVEGKSAVAKGTLTKQGGTIAVSLK